MMLATLTSQRSETDTEPSDDTLMLTYARGDENAFDVLYERYKQPVYQYLFRNCTDVQAADEMFQNVWLRLIGASKRYKGKGRFRSYLFTLAHNTLVDYYRSNEKRRLLEQQSFEENGDDIISSAAAVVPSDVESLSLERRQQLIEETLNSISHVQREAFYLKQESDFSIEEIAEIQNISREAAKSRLRYAYSKLRLALKEETNEQL